MSESRHDQPGYRLQVTTDNGHVIPPELVEWELDCWRTVYVRVSFSPNTYIPANGQISVGVKITDSDENLPVHAEILPGVQAVRGELLPAFLDALRQAENIAYEADLRLTARQEAWALDNGATR